MQFQTSESDMFVPSNNYSPKGNDPISYSDQAFYHHSRPFSLHSESNPTPKQLDLVNPSSPPFSFFHFPNSCPFEDFLEQHNDLLLQFHHHQQPLPHDPKQHNPEPQPVIISTMEASTKSTEQIQRKKPGKRDRHSKINTARGLRDRRMRLSLEVAKKFFGLQDMLGFEKASKTVEWLLNQAKAEINQLKVAMMKRKNQHGAAKSASSTSECEEGVSSLDEVVVSGNQEKEQEKVPKVVKRRRKMEHSRKSAFPIAKECRERARERARERTKEKMRSRGIVEECREGTDHDLNQFGSWNPFETGEECGIDQNHSVNNNPSLDEAKEGSYHAKEHFEHHDSLAILSPSMIFNSLSNSGLTQEVSFSYITSIPHLLLKAKDSFILHNMLL